MAESVIDTAAAVAALPRGSVLLGTEGVARLEKEGWIVSGYVFPRTHDDVEEFLGGYPLEVIHHSEQVWTRPTWGDVAGAVGDNWASDPSDVAEAVMRLMYPDGGWNPSAPVAEELAEDEHVRVLFDTVVYPEVKATLQHHLQAMIDATSRPDRFFTRIPRNTIALAIGALQRLGEQRDAAEDRLAAAWGEIDHAAANDHRLDHRCIGVGPGEVVPAVRTSSLEAALTRIQRPTT